MVVMFMLLGLILGSFLAAFSWRLPKHIPISKGRSFCPNCRKKIEWFDNIPIISFFLLGRRCRNCKNEISPRYFLIEIFTALLFGLVYVFREEIITNLTWISNISILISLPYLLFIAFIVLAIFIIDLETMLIPDELVFLGMLVTLLVFLATGQSIYINLFTGFGFGLVFLLLNLITLGRGMGLGDAKLVILLGFIAGPVVGIIFLMTSFMLGALVGVLLILLKEAKLQQKIAFGPYLVLGFLGSILFAHEIIRFF